MRAAIGRLPQPLDLRGGRGSQRGRGRRRGEEGAQLVISGRAGPGDRGESAPHAGVSAQGSLALLF